MSYNEGEYKLLFDDWALLNVLDKITWQTLDAFKS